MAANIARRACGIASKLSSRAVVAGSCQRFIPQIQIPLAQFRFNLHSKECIEPVSVKSNWNLGVVSPLLRLPITITVPQAHIIQPLQNPAFNDSCIEDPRKPPTVTDNPSPSHVKKEAARLVVIRRKKMNKHKLKKLRRKMKYVWAKVKIRREIRKEKEFLNAQMARIREAQTFDAKAYVADILRRAKEEPLPTRWEGKFFPEPMIRQKMEIDAKRKQQEYLSILDKRRHRQDKK